DRPGAGRRIRRAPSPLRLQEEKRLPAVAAAVRPVRPVPAGLLRVRVQRPPDGSRPQRNVTVTPLLLRAGVPPAPQTPASPHRARCWRPCRRQGPPPPPPSR